MKLAKFAPFMMLPALAIGCAQAGDDEVDANEGAASASGALEFTSSVGAVVVEGKRLCTAALVDVDAEAKIGSVSASGRQVVLGGACIGKLKNGFVGGAAFVTQANGVSLATPILSIDFESQASAGLAVGILSAVPADTKPIRLLGVSASVNAGISGATVLRANDDGVLFAARAEVHAGVEFGLVTKCTEFRFAAKAGIAVGAGVGADEDSLGAAAIVKVDGELRFAAHIDGQCIVHQIKETARKIKTATLDAANDLGDGIAKAGAGKVIATYALKDEKRSDGRPESEHTVTLRLYEDASEIRLNAQGRLSARLSKAEGFDIAGASSCDRELLGACKIRLANNQTFRAGTTFDLTLDTHGNVFPDREDGTRVFVSVPKK